MRKLSTSVLISTYNGEKYIIEQLVSIRNQSVPVDEVIIRDDQSSDHTAKVVEEYIEKNDLKQWKLIRNTQNMGWKRNFHCGMDDCTKDLIFLCDQDDIWNVDKVKDMVEVMSNNSSINVLVSDFSLKYENNVKDSRYDVFKGEMNNSGHLQQLHFDSRWPYIKRPGCTYCVRKSFFMEIQEFWDERISHDGILWRFSMASDSLWKLQKNEIQFRRHGGNVTGTRELSIASRLEEINLFILSFRQVYKYCKKRGDLEKCQLLKRGLKWLTIRKEMFQQRKCWLWFILALRYEKYYSSYKGLLGDVLYYFKGV